MSDDTTFDPLATVEQHLKLNELLNALSYVTPEQFEQVLELAHELAWDTQFANTPVEFWQERRKEIEDDIKAGRTRPMFDEQGNWLMDTYTDDDFKGTTP